MYTRYISNGAYRGGICVSKQRQINYMINHLLVKILPEVADMFAWGRL